jgi:hypothetical protein
VKNCQNRLLASRFQARSPTEGQVWVPVRA